MVQNCASEADPNADGIPDSWEQQYFGSITNCAPHANSDGDGMPSLFEKLADSSAAIHPRQRFLQSSY